MSVTLQFSERALGRVTRLEKRTCADALDGNGLRPLGARREGFLWLVESSIEQGVDESRFSQTRFTLKRWRQQRHDTFSDTTTGDVCDIPTTMAVNWKPFLTLFL
jgi:hypothetical protein